MSTNLVLIHRKSAKLPWNHNSKLSFWSLSFYFRLLVFLLFYLFAFMSFSLLVFLSFGGGLYEYTCYVVLFVLLFSAFPNITQILPNIAAILINSKAFWLGLFTIHKFQETYNSFPVSSRQKSNQRTIWRKSKENQRKGSDLR